LSVAAFAALLLHFRAAKRARRLPPGP